MLHVYLTLIEKKTHLRTRLLDPRVGLIRQITHDHALFPPDDPPQKTFRGDLPNPRARTLWFLQRILSPGTLECNSVLPKVRSVQREDGDNW